MKTITFNHKKYDVPTTWRDVTLRMQLEVSKIESTQAHVKTIAVIAAYTGIPILDLRNAKVEQLAEIMSVLAFIDTPINTKPVFNFMYKGHEYNVMESLINNQFQDYVACQTAISEYDKDMWKQLSYLAAILAKRNGETLDSFDVNERAEYMMDLDVNTCNGIAAFFLSNQKALDFISQWSSPQTVEVGLENKLRELENTLNQLQKHRGKNLLIRLWIGISRNYIKSIRSQSVKSLNSPASKPLKMSWMQTLKKLLWKKHVVKNKSK